MFARNVSVSLKYFLALAVLVLATTTSFADPIAIHSTGAAGAPACIGTPQTPGPLDPYYQLVAPFPTDVPNLPTVRTTSLVGSWMPPPAGACWVNYLGYPIIGSPGGIYDYQTTFSLSGLNPNTAVLTGVWAADNQGYIELNGIKVAGTTTPDSTGFKLPGTTFTITGGFGPGPNTLDFIVNNTDDPSLTGLLVSISGTASPIPEPSSLLLLGSGLVGLAGIVRRKLPR